MVDTEEYAPQRQKSPLAEFMAKRRQELGMNQLDLHVASGVSAGTIASIESGLSQSPKAETLEKLAKGLKVSYHELDCIVRGVPFQSHKQQESEPLREFEIYLRAHPKMPAEVAETLIDMVQMVVKKYD